jgi:predicted ATPase/class 3 adenylate cyclase
VAAPSGTVTFLFTDVEGSTRLWEAAPDAMRTALARHDEIVRSAIAAHGGHVFSTGGDGFAAAFARAGDGLAAAVEAQTRLSMEVWPDKAPLLVRMGLHTGEVEERGGDYFGLAVNRAARLMAVAHGGQVVCSQATAVLAGPAVNVRNLGEHRLRDLNAAEPVFQVSGEVFPPLRSVDLVPTNLPTVRTELIGRHDDVAALSALVDRAQLVTLTGTGGVGKTRLALGVAAALAPGFADGCWLVELAPVADGAEVLKTIASSIGATATDLDALTAYLSDRRMLVVLDNCEHVLADTADLVDAVLAAAPEVHVVATSREPLGLDGEAVRRVQSLDVPSPDAPMEEAARAPAVRLFMERAGSVSETFTIDAANAGAVVELCRHLDGIPLAIELAAALVRAMPPAEIASRLGERFRLLAGGSRRAQERHRTLLAAVAWSHDLLSDDERRVFRRLAVFPSSFDLAAAEAVAGGDGLDVLGSVVRLVDRSLVQYEPKEGRYRLLETLRQYAADRLDEAVETDGTRERHARDFLGLVERFAPQLLDGRYQQAQAVLQSELDNLRAVAEWCVVGGRWTELLGMVRRLWTFLWPTAPVDAASWYGHVVHHAAAVEPQDVADALGEMAFLGVISLADYPAALAWADQSLSLAEREGVLESPWAWYARSMFAIFTTASTEALLTCDRARAAAEARHDEFAVVNLLGHRANCLAQLGNAEEAALCAAEGLDRAELACHPINIQSNVVCAANIYLFVADRPDFNATLVVLSDHDDGSRLNPGLAMWLDLLWGTALVGVHRRDAVGRLTGAIRLADRLSAPHVTDLGLRMLAVAAAELGRAQHAATLIGYCDTNLRPHRVRVSLSSWIESTIDDALSEMNDRQFYEAAGAASSRGQIMALIAQLDSAVQGAATGAG